MTTDNYVAPEEENLDGEAKQPADGGKKDVVKTSTAPKTTQPSLDEPVQVIGIAKMTNAKGDETTAVYEARIIRHLKYLSGEVGFKDAEEREKEQMTFIESIGNTLKLPFEQYVVVTDFLLNEIRKNADIFSNGTVFRFTSGLDKMYPIEHIRTYRNYMTMLTMIANNWSRRYELNKVLDVTYTIKDLPRVGKENVTQYINKLMSRV